MKNRQKVKSGLKIRKNRIFSEELKKRIVEDLVYKRIKVTQASRLYEVTRSSLYKWLYKYSAHHHPGTRIVIEMESEEQKRKGHLERISQLERIIGQKQLEIDYLNKLLEIGSKELGLDLKKTFEPKPLNGSESNKNNTDTP